MYSFSLKSMYVPVVLLSQSLLAQPIIEQDKMLIAKHYALIAAHIQVNYGDIITDTPDNCRLLHSFLFFLDYSLSEIDTLIIQAQTIKMTSYITVQDIIETVVRSFIGHQAPDLDQRTEEERYYNAIHEAGHALVAHKLGNIILQASIQRYERANGYTYNIPSTIYPSTEQIVRDIAVAMGGYAAEQVIFNTLNILNYDQCEYEHDIPIACSLIEDIEKNDEVSTYDGASAFLTNHGLLTDTIAAMPLFTTLYGTFKKEGEVKALFIATCFIRACTLLKESSNTVSKIADYLVAHTEINRQQFCEIIA